MTMAPRTTIQPPGYSEYSVLSVTVARLLLPGIPRTVDAESARTRQSESRLKSIAPLSNYLAPASVFCSPRVLLR